MRVAHMEKHWYGNKYVLISENDEKANIDYNGQSYTMTMQKHSFMKIPTSQAAFIVGSDVCLQYIVDMNYDYFVNRLLESLPKNLDVIKENHNPNEYALETKEKLCDLANNGNTKAMYSLAVRYLNGNNGIPQDYGMAYVWFNIFCTLESDEFVEYARKQRQELCDWLTQAKVINEYQRISSSTLNEIRKNHAQTQNG